MTKTMTIGELKKIIDAIHELHGPEANTAFVYQKASGRTARGDITSFRVSVGDGLLNFVTFNLDYPRGKEE
jgi:hypothetical protein